MSWPDIVQYRRVGDEELLDAIPLGADERNFEIMIYTPVPVDAATARTAESEVDETPKLFIPPAARVAHLIRDAMMWEDAARADEKAGRQVDVERCEIRLNRAMRLRVKAICLHLEIEEK